MKLWRSGEKEGWSSMKNYRVTIYFSSIIEVEAENEAEAEDKADRIFKGRCNVVPIPDEYEVECLDEEDED